MDTFWWIAFRTEAARSEMDQDGLFEIGARGTEEPEDAGAAGSGTILLKAYFGDAEAYRRALDRFADRAELQGGEAPTEDWDRSWRDRQTPVEVTPSLTVVPPWLDAPAKSGLHVIRLEAKMAFGTGSHETTRICALLLERHGAQGARVLDIGAGTGILALYAARLGALEVLALDIDPVAGPCLQENLGLNPAPPGCRFRNLIGETSALAPDARFDVILCNMIRTELWPFREELRERLAPRGVFIVSGQRDEDKPYFLEWQERSPFTIVAEESQNGWWGFMAKI